MGMYVCIYSGRIRKIGCLKRVERGREWGQSQAKKAKSKTNLSISNSKSERRVGQESKKILPRPFALL